MRVVCYQVEREGVLVERFLRQQGLSHRLLVDLKKDENGLTVDGRPVRTIDRLHAGNVVRVRVTETDRSDIVPQHGLPLPIVYEDEDLFVIDKPAGIAVHPSPGNRENTIANALAALYETRGEPFAFRAIGRLDKNTSGLLVLAKHALSACLLTTAAAQKHMHHAYLAVCTGRLTDEDTIDTPIGRADGSVIRRETRPDGEHAVTHYRRLAYRDGYSLAHIWLETGRTHQIRVHMASIGHALPGDFLYGTESERIARHALHAAFLTVPQPVTGEILHFAAPLPDDMQAFFPDWTPMQSGILPEHE